MIRVVQPSNPNYIILERELRWALKQTVPEIAHPENVMPELLESCLLPVNLDQDDHGIQISMTDQVWLDPQCSRLSKEEIERLIQTCARLVRECRDAYRSTEQRRQERK